MNSRRLTLITLIALTAVTVLVGIVGSSILFRKVAQAKYRSQAANNNQYGVRFAAAVDTLLRHGVPRETVLEYLQDTLDGTPMDHGRYLCILTEDGKVLCHPDTERIGGTAEEQLDFRTLDADRIYPFKEWVQLSDRQALALDKQGVPFQLVQRVPIDGAPWMVLVHTDLSELHEEALELNRLILIFLIPMGVSFILIGTLVVRTLGRRYEAAIEETNHHLEERVAERTAELERTVAELRKAHSALELKEKLALVGQLMAGIAHEIRNPIGAITLIAGVLEEDAKDPDDREAAAKILRTAERCEQIVLNLLAFARNEPPILVPTRVGDLPGGALSFATSEFKGSGVRFERKLDGQDLTIEADHVQLEQVILNLLTNSYQEVRGRENATMRLVAVPMGPLLRLVVEDNGPGLPPELEEHLFEPFQTRKSDGTGLGLSLCRRFVERHGGRIAYDRSPTLGGARFTIELPFSQKDRLTRESDTAGLIDDQEDMD